MAASEFCTNGVYSFERSDRNAEQMIDYYADLLDDYPLVSIEDPLAGVIGIGESGITDGSQNHDHYLYGTPKRQ